MDVDPCIFEGHLEYEPETNALLTGGCPLEDSFDVSRHISKIVFIALLIKQLFFFKVQFKSRFSNDYLFKVVDGNVEVVQPPFQTSTTEN